jgi:hypothetical protein
MAFGPFGFMNYDNQTVIGYPYTQLSRLVKRCLKIVRKLRNSGVITVAYIQIDKNLADNFIEGLSRNVTENALREMEKPS